MEASSIRTARCAQVFYLFLISFLSAVQVQLLPLANAWIYRYETVERLQLTCNIFYVVMQIPYGYLATIWKAQRILAFGATFSGVMTLLLLKIGPVSNYLTLLVYYAFTGFFWGPTIPCIHALLPKLVPVSQVTGYVVGTFVARSFGKFILQLALYHDQNLDRAIIFVGVISLLTGLLYFCFGRNEIYSESLVVNIRTVGFRKEVISFARTEKKHDVPVLKILTSFPVLVLILAQCFNELTVMVMSMLELAVSFSLPYFVSPPDFAAFLPLLVTTIFVLIMGWITDRNTNKGNRVIRKVMAAISSLVPAVVFILWVFLPRSFTSNFDNESIKTLIALVLIAKATSAVYYCSYFVNPIDLSPSNAGFIMGIANTFVTLVSMFSRNIWRLINEKMGITSISFLDGSKSTPIACVICYGVSFLLFALFGKTNIQPWDDQSLIRA